MTRKVIVLHLLTSQILIATVEKENAQTFTLKDVFYIGVDPESMKPSIIEYNLDHVLVMGSEMTIYKSNVVLTSQGGISLNLRTTYLSLVSGIIQPTNPVQILTG